MQAGWLRHRISIQEKTVTRDAYGEEDFTWSTWKTVWGSVQPLRGREYMQATTEQVVYDTKIRLRYRTGVTPEQRISWNSKFYDIRSVHSVLERNRELELWCLQVHE